MQQKVLQWVISTTKYEWQLCMPKPPDVLSLSSNKGNNTENHPWHHCKCCHWIRCVGIPIQLNVVVLWRKLLADLLVTSISYKTWTCNNVQDPVVYITQTLEANHSQNYISITHKVGTIKIYINLFVVPTFY